MTPVLRFRSKALAFALLYGLSAAAALFVTQGEDGIAAIWPPSGVFIAGLLLTPRVARGWLVGGVATASLLTNLWFDVTLWDSVGYTIANILEGLIVWYFMGERRGTSFAHPATIGRFFGASLVGGTVSAIMAGLLSLNFDSGFLWSWASTVILGMITVTPTIMFLMQDKTRRQRLISPSGLAMLGVVGGFTVAAFAQESYPLLFLPMVGLAFATLVSGLSGAGMGVVVVAAVGSVFTALGKGPVTIAFDDIQERVIYFQAYLVCLVASILPLAILLARHQGEARKNLELAETDTLTGLATRRKILADLDAAIQRARKSGKPLSIAMIDIDHFKPINDRFGHEKGDEILSTLTAIMRGELGGEARLGRLGGEEFLAIFERDARDVYGPSDRLRKRAERHQWPLGGPDRVTLSVGIAQLHDGHDEAGFLLRDADIALYEAKEAGRNRIRIRQRP